MWKKQGKKRKKNYQLWDSNSQCSPGVRRFENLWFKVEFLRKIQNKTKIDEYEDKVE